MHSDRPAALLLDLDETLFDNSFVPKTIEPACAAVVAAHPSIVHLDLTTAYDAASKKHWPEAGPKCVIGELDALEVSREIWRHALKACGCDDVTIVDVAHETHQQLLTREARLFDDVPEFLQALTHAAIPSALVTNGSTTLQLAKLKAVGLDRFFTELVISADLAVAKPDPAIFRAAVERLGLDPADCWHVGDSLASDVAGAQSAGLHTIWLNRTCASPVSTDARPDVEVQSLLELVPWLTGE